MSIVPGTWAQLPIITPQDVLDEAKDIAGTMQAVGSRFDSDLTAKCAYAKNTRIQPELMARLPQLYASTALLYPVAMPFPAWLFQQGYSLTSLDSVLDHVVNPEVLKPWAAMEVIDAVLLDAMIGFNAGRELGDVQLLKIVKGEIAAQIALRRPRSIQALKLDLNQDDQVTDNERVGTKMQVLWRR